MMTIHPLRLASQLTWLKGACAALVILSASSRAADVSLNVGALEVVALPPAHAGFYPYIGGAMAFPAGPFTAVTSLSLEVSFDQGRGGLVALASLDYAFTKALGVDVFVALIHDQPRLSFSESLFFLGGGPGLSIFLGRWTLSPFLGLFAGLNAPGWSLVPGLNVSWTVGAPLDAGSIQ